jgi:hypothetical protein
MPGCTAPASWCEAHHLQPWQHGGPTDLPNLALLLCSHHHHWLHAHSRNLERRADGGWAVVDDPWSRERTRACRDHPPPLPPPPARAA